MNDKKRTLTLGSLFDGSGGFPLAGVLSGIRPLWASEVEPFAVRVTTKRLPGMKHYGDVSKLSGAELPPVDIITFGSPCQDMSIAGKRAGLEGERSGLFHEAIRIIKEMREKTNGEYPRYCVWENVPGAFSSNNGEDFKAVLEAVIGVKEPSCEMPAPGKNGWSYADVYLGDGWSVAYRLLDAQFWGVPQRRARIFLVADFAGERAGDILFKSEGLSGYSAEGFEAWEGTARNPAAGFGEAGGPAVCVNPQGSSGIQVSEDKTGTLVAQDHGHHPAVLAAGFCTEHSAKSRTIGYEEETSPTLRAGVVPATVYENHSQDSRYTGPLETAPTVSATYGMGGNNQPFVVEEIAVPYTLKIRSGKEGGGKGALWQEDKSATLATSNDQALFAPAVGFDRYNGDLTGEVAQTINACAGTSGDNQPMVFEQKAFGISSEQSHAMLSDNPHAGVYEAETARTLDAQCGHPGCHQGGIAVVEKAYSLQGNMIGRSEKNGPQGKGIGEDVAFTLTGTDQQGVAAPVYHGTKNSHLTSFSDSPALDTLVATEYKEPPVVSHHPYYIVRRLTPVECARLQGFPDWWCDGLETPEPTEEDIAFWTDVFETHRLVVTQAKKPKTRNQIVKWLQQPYLDSAAYRLWGNGVALPCVWFVLAGIVYCDQLDS
jgi:DNA (cytosine-5)-methyltransferase 1